MNILLATDASLERGGITLFMLQWIRGIREIDKDGIITVYFKEYIENQEIAKEYEDLGVTIITGDIPGIIKLKSPKARKKIKGDIRKILSEKHYDAVHVNSGVFGYNAMILAEAKKQGVRVRVAHSHGSYPERWYDKITHFFLRRRILSTATACAGCSEKAGRYLYGEAGVSGKKWRFVPNTIQTEKFQFSETARVKYRNSIGIKQDEILLGAIGHLSSVKNHSFLIEMMANLSDFSAKLIIIGQGADKEKLEKQIKEKGVEERVILFGPSMDVPGWLSAMDLYLMPSLSEGFPISAIEAQASGLPCVFSDRISNEVDLIRNVCHLSIDNGVEEWANILRISTLAAAGERKDAAEIIRKAGFDGSDTKEYVKKLYIC